MMETITGRQRGDAAEAWVAHELQRVFAAACSVVNTSRSPQQGDIRLCVHADGQEPVRIMIECKDHANTVDRRCVSSFREHLATQASWAEAGLFVSLSSNVHGHEDFALSRTLTGPPLELCCISRVAARPAFLEAAVRMLVSRVLDHRRNSEAVGATASTQRTQDLSLTVDSLSSAMESLEAALLGTMQRLHQTRRIVERVDRQITGLPVRDDCDAS